MSGDASNSGRYDVGEVKSRLPMLEVVGACGVVVRRAGSVSKCICPFHGERSASMVIYEDHAHCFGCNWNGDIFAWWMKMKGVDFKRALSDLAGMAGVRALEEGEARVWRANALARPVAAVRERERPELPDLGALSAGELAALGAQRGISLAGVRGAAERGLLWGCWFQGQRAWCLTDRARRNAQLRRLDGGRWYGDVKAWTVAGSWAAWPVGCTGFGTAGRIALVEGGPDALALCDLLAQWGWGRGDCGLAVMFGASASIAPWCLGKFQGARVRIFAHNDLAKGPGGARAGFVAAERWVKQLGSVARGVDWVSAPEGLALPNGDRVCDVNDVLVWERAEAGRAGVVSEGWRF